MREDDAQVVYDQYWNHDRHIENEMLSFSKFYAVIVAGLFIALKTPCDENKYFLIFVFLLSVFGFLFNYNLRIPFIKFILKAELIAIKELKIPTIYRRFFDEHGHLFKDKFIDTYDIFALLYISVITLSSFILFNIIVALILLVIFLIIHFNCREKLHKIKIEIRDSSSLE